MLATLILPRLFMSYFPSIPPIFRRREKRRVKKRKIPLREVAKANPWWAKGRIKRVLRAILRRMAKIPSFTGVFVSWRA